MSQHRIVALAAGRGGSAKTTLTFAVGDVLHRLRGIADVALLDLDPQANLTSYAGEDPVGDPLTAESVRVHGMTLYRGGRALASASVPERARFTDRALSEGSTERVVIADLPPALHDPSHRTLFDRDDVLWMGAIRAEPGSFQSLNELVAMCARAQAPYVLVPTFYVTNRSVISATTMALRSQHAGHVSRTVIPDDSKAKECVLSAMPVTTFAPKAKVSVSVVALVDEVFGLGSPAAAAARQDDGAASKRDPQREQPRDSLNDHMPFTTATPAVGALTPPRPSRTVSPTPRRPAKYPSGSNAPRPR